MKQFRLLLLSIIALSISFSECKSDFDDVLCDEELNKFDNALENRELWALKLFDTWAKLPSGLLHGSRGNPGHFTECVKFRHEGIQGQHCMVSAVASSNRTSEGVGSFDWQEIGSFAHRNNFDFVHGICLPASCSSVKVIEYANAILTVAGLHAITSTCRTNDAIPFKFVDILAVVVLSLLALALISSTLYEVFTIKANKTPNKLLAAFSVYTNGARLFDITERKSPSVVSCLNGIRALSIFWIIFGHRFDDRNAVPVYNEESSRSYPRNPIYLLYTNYERPVDTFLLIGGMLACWSLLNALDKKTVNIPRMYLHRYLRYTPTMAVMILVFTSLTKYFASGPFFNPPTENCEKYWWTALLHVSVYTNPNKLCYDLTWYLTVDFQLFLVSPLLIYPLWKWGYKFFGGLSILIILVQICTFVTTYKHEIMVFNVAIASPGGADLFDRVFYYPTHLRIGVWVVGIMLGYVMYQTRGRRVKIPKAFNVALWALSLTIIFGILIAMYWFHQLENNTTSRFGNALFCAILRVGWALGVAWMIFACHNGSGGGIRWLLSLPQWQPMGRMGLSIYLVHRFYQFVTLYNEKQPIYWDFFNQTQKALGDYVVAIFLGSILYLAVEIPIVIIESYLHNEIKKRIDVKK